MLGVAYFDKTILSVCVCVVLTQHDSSILPDWPIEVFNMFTSSTVEAPISAHRFQSLGFDDRVLGPKEGGPSPWVHSRGFRKYSAWCFGPFFIFPFSWEFHHPNWLYDYFQRGCSFPQVPSNQMIISRGVLVSHRFLPTRCSIGGWNLWKLFVSFFFYNLLSAFASRLHVRSDCLQRTEAVATRTVYLRNLGKRHRHEVWIKQGHTSIWGIWDRESEHDAKLY